MKLLTLAFPLLSLIACNSTKPATENASTVTSAAASSSANADQQKSATAGNDLMAVGNEPVNWHLEIDFDGKSNFQSDDGISLSYATNKLKKSMSGTTETYSGKTDAGEIKIVVTEGTCTVPTVRMAFSKSISLSFKGKTYTGCGKFLADEGLNGKWNLEKLGNEMIASSDYNKAPFLNFELTKNRVSGTDGCNSIGSDIEVQGSRIKFGAMIGTKMACNKKDVGGKLALLGGERPVDYRLAKGKLLLYLSDDSILTFNRG